ncbi:PIG-L deacetylase family protein [Amycolatopsis benzoatilytica]|uniref:PIG-L deacetylase family protein n=1 Tax=Amycolatopsis benzoatilytica TaxID=346045 RepID=UPI00035CCD5C|nr:PIG-L deacetylase family protein [Amycolatopsis benzoatilytica]
MDTVASPPAGMTSVLAVIAHPDDESFGLGAVIDAVVASGGRVAVLCFTRGGASTLGGRRPDLATVRAAEFGAAAAILGVTETELLDYPDGGLSSVPLPELAGHVLRLAARTAVSHLLAFDTGGVTGHPDHAAATAAAAAAAARLDLPVVGWTLPASIADRLNAELGTAFTGHPLSEVDWTLPVDRSVQRRAIAAHASQATHNPVLVRRLEMLGALEHLRLLAGHADGERR